MNNLTDKIWVRILVLAIAIISPFLCIGIEGELSSYSAYWGTDMRPIFIFTNAATSYFLYSMKNWWFPALFLMFLTAFAIDQYLWVHNITAILFFIFCGISIRLGRKYDYYLIPYLSSIIFLIFFGILWAEIVAILTICAYHTHRLIKFYRISNRRPKSL